MNWIARYWREIITANVLAGCYVLLLALADYGARQ